VLYILLAQPARQGIRIISQFIGLFKKFSSAVSISKTVMALELGTDEKREVGNGLSDIGRSRPKLTQPSQAKLGGKPT
jgi:hypothetical protein